MTISKKYLRDWGESARIHITPEQKRIILERFGTEPEPYEWSEQDVCAQIRNYLYRSHWEKPSIYCGTAEVLPPGVEF
jgi:hypothetical protein